MRVTVEYVRDLERRIASLERRLENIAALVEGPAPWDEDYDPYPGTDEGDPNGR